MLDTIRTSTHQSITILLRVTDSQTRVIWSDITAEPCIGSRGILPEFGELRGKLARSKSVALAAKLFGGLLARSCLFLNIIIIGVVVYAGPRT